MEISVEKKWRDVIYEDLPSETKKLLKFYQKRKKNQIPVFFYSIFFPLAQSKTKILIQFFDARSASEEPIVILFFGILFEHQFNNLIEFSENYFFVK
jgi:hypothetical protein